MLIACSTDRRYVEMLGVLVRSISVHHQTGTVAIVVFCRGLDSRARKKIASCASNAVTIRFVPLTEDKIHVLSRLPTARHLSLMAYARLFIPELLADRRGKLIYLDVDMVVNNSLTPLWEADLRDNLIAAVPVEADPALLSRFNRAIDRSDTEPYFNSGTLVINLERWREAQIGERGLHYAANRTGPIIHHDQAVLNKIIGDDWLRLDRRWNQSPSGLSLQEAEKIAILHFKGRKKPFFFDYPYEAIAIYDRFRAQTPWRNAWRETRKMRSIRKRLDKLAVWKSRIFCIR